MSSIRPHPGSRTLNSFLSICPCQQTPCWNQAGLKRQKAATTSQFSFKPNADSCLINWCSSSIKLLLFDLNFWSLRKATMTSFSRAIKKGMLTSFQVTWLPWKAVAGSGGKGVIGLVFYCTFSILCRRIFYVFCCSCFLYKNIFIFKNKLIGPWTKL